MQLEQQQRQQQLLQQHLQAWNLVQLHSSHSHCHQQQQQQQQQQQCTHQRLTPAPQLQRLLLLPPSSSCGGSSSSTPQMELLRKLPLSLLQLLPCFTAEVSAT
jgi:hypothetical protein